MIEDKISRIPYNNNSLNTLSFFSGALGLDLGLEEAGLNVLLACEFDKHCRATDISEEGFRSFVIETLKNNPELIYVKQ